MLRFHWFPPSLSPPTTGKGQEWCPVALIPARASLEAPKFSWMLGAAEILWQVRTFRSRGTSRGYMGVVWWDIPHMCSHNPLSAALVVHLCDKNTIFYNDVCIISRMDKNLGFGGGETKDWIFVLSLTHCISVVIYNTSLNLVSLTCKVKLTSLTQRFWRAWDENICVKCWVQPWHIASAV